MNYKNAVESWSLFDTVLVGSNAKTLFSGAGFFDTYAELGQRNEIPFFNARNNSVGVQYCNLDSANKLPFAFYCYSIGIDIEAPMVRDMASGDPSASQNRSNLFFSADLAKHVGFILRVSQDEKLVNTAMLMPSGQGISGAHTITEPTVSQSIAGFANTGIGENIKTNRWKFPEPIEMPREVNFDGKLILSTYAQEALQAMVGPGAWDRNPTSPCTYPMMSQIRVTLYGKREVQQRNEQHYN